MPKWNKKGLIYEPSATGFGYASHPCIIDIDDDQFVLAFTGRDENQRSHIFLTHVKVSNGNLEMVSQPKLALAPGAPGYFDCDGVISGCFVKHKNLYVLYFVGWQNLPEGLWLCDTGRAILEIDDLSLRKEFPGPVLGRDRDHPLFLAATAFHINSDGTWHTWYNSGIRWEKKGSHWKHFYGIHHAHSSDGLDWTCDPEMCIPFKDEYEYAFGRPSVVFWEGKYNMWFAHRASYEISSYRMGFATSEDGLTWDRADHKAGIDVSESGWDSEMICYPCVFEHKGIKYMLYNGNGYGRTGFGLAVLEEDK